MLCEPSDIKIVENPEDYRRCSNGTTVTEKRHSLEDSTLHGTRFKEMTNSIKQEPMIKSQFAISEIKIDSYKKDE